MGSSKQNKKAEQLFFDRKAEIGCYDTGENYEEIFHLFGLDLIHRGGESILDAGCGTDAYGIRLAKHGYAAVGVDISRKECEHVRNRISKESTYFPVVLGDLEKLPFRSGVFNNIFCGGVLHHFKDFEPPLREMTRVLKKGGRIILVEPSGSDPVTVFYFLINKFLLRLGRRGYQTLNEVPHSIKSYLSVLQECEVTETRVHVLKRNPSISVVKRALVARWQSLLPLVVGGDEIAIIAHKRN